MAEDLQYAINLIRSGKSVAALHILQDICNQQPNNPNAWTWQGMLLAQDMNYPEAEICIRHLIRLQPNNPMAHRMLGDVLAMQRKFSVAIDEYRTSLSINPDQAGIHTNLSQCMKELRRIPEAIDAAIQELKINSKQPLIHRNLGLLYEMLHRTNEARVHAQAALDLNSNDIESHILLAKLDSREGNYSDAMLRLKQQLELCSADLHKAMLHLELGRVLDHVGDHKEAFVHITSGNTLLAKVHSVTPQITAQYRTNIDRYRHYYSPERVRKWLSLPLPEKPIRVIFLVGFPRSGTTLTEQILESHDEVVATDELPALTDIIRDVELITGKAIRYPDDIDLLSDNDIALLRRAYLDNIKCGLGNHIGEDSVILDKFPLNIVHLGFIARILPEARIIVALRDPRDACLSCYMQSFQLNQAMSQFLNIDDTGRFYACVMGLWRHYQNIEGLNVLVSKYEDIVDDLEASARRLLDFCELEWDDNILEFYNQAKRRYVRTPSYQAIANPIYRNSIGKWRNYANEIQSLMAYIEIFIDDFDYQA